MNETIKLTKNQRAYIEYIEQAGANTTDRQAALAIGIVGKNLAGAIRSLKSSKTVIDELKRRRDQLSVIETLSADTRDIIYTTKQARNEALEAGKHSDVVRCNDLLAKILNLYPERITHTETVTYDISEKILKATARLKKEKILKKQSLTSFSSQNTLTKQDKTYIINTVSQP